MALPPPNAPRPAAKRLFPYQWRFRMVLRAMKAQRPGGAIEQPASDLLDLFCQRMLAGTGHGGVGHGTANLWIQPGWSTCGWR